MDVSQDAYNCGACNNVCPVGSFCQGSECVCPGSASLCDAGCVDTTQDASNCGACGTACSTGALCQDGACQCQSGLADCSGVCVDLDGNGSNCGACGHACAADEVCSAGTCSVQQCGVGQTQCGSSCVDLQSDASNCGACGYACASGQLCSEGSCGCSLGRSACNGSCVDLENDASNCGTCGDACAAGQLCSAGECGCPTGRLDCDGVCINPLTDPANCGACGQACSGGESCSNGACGCETGQERCGDTCTDTSTDTYNCGACGNTCGDGKTCDAGSCAGGISGSGGSGGSDGCASGTFSIDATLSDTIASVGIVSWSFSGPMSDARIDFGRESGNWEFSAPVESPSTDANRTLLLGMKTSTTYSYQITVTSDGSECSSAVRTIETGAIRQGLPSVKVSTSSPSEAYGGFTVACQNGGGGGRPDGGGSAGYAFIFDHDGDIVWWYQSTTGATSQCTQAAMSYDGGHMYMGTLNVGNNSSGRLARVLMDGTNEESYDVPDLHHDFCIGPDGNIAFIEFAESGIGGGMGEGCDNIIELDPETGARHQVVAMADVNPAGASSCHSNAINWWPDQNLYTVSSLNWNAISAFDRSGEVSWILGGSASTFSGASWNAQHNHHLVSADRVLLFNNRGSGGSSLALEFGLEGSSATQVFSYAGGVQSQTLGDAKRLPNGNTLVTYSNNGVIHEVNASGQLVESIEAGSMGYTIRRSSLYGPPPPWVW